MAVSPSAFFRFLGENTALVLAIGERGDVDDAELLSLAGRHRSEVQASPAHLSQQIKDLGIVERAAHADARYELARPVTDIVDWLTKRQRLSSATVLRAYLADLASVGQELDQSIQGGNPSTATLALRDADGLVERVRQLSGNNRDSIVTEAQLLRSTKSTISSVDRFEAVRRLWERYLEPLRQLVEIQGEMEGRLDRLDVMLTEGERRFLAHGTVQQAIVHTAARLARMRSAAHEDHHAAIVEVAPLYDRLQRESRWARGASRALQLLRAQGPSALDLDRRMGLTGWRTRSLLSDDKLRARLAGLVGYTSEDTILIGASPPPVVVPLIARDELRDALHAAAPVEDVLAFILTRWPGHSLGAQLRAFGHVAAGAFGRVLVRDDAQARIYEVTAGRLEAWPLAFMEVAA
ncbi:MAG: hypothetical protein JNL90_10750 [Planctomycetes bacterium]|nr:hypothetical protein [Planctomycetota bacterium]